MNEKKRLPIIISFVFFLLTGVVIYSGVFDLPQNVFKESPLDHLYLIMVNLLFWFPGAFLVNKMMDSFVWKKIIVFPVGNVSARWIQDFIWSLIYIFAFTAVINSAFFVIINASTIFILLLLLFAATILKTKLLSLFTTGIFDRNRPFNKGDWISVKSKDGKVLVVGEVYNFNRGAVSIKNEDNNLVFITSQVLTNSIIENYRSFADNSRFNLEINLDNSVPVERGKRILLAATINALEEANILKSSKPEILVECADGIGIRYKIIFWIKPWQGITPSQIKDMILSKILDHTNKSGVIITPHKRIEVNNSNQAVKSTNFNFINDRATVLKKIEFLDVLNETELLQLSGSLKIHYLKKGEKIIAQGDNGDSMFILIEGLLDVKIIKESGENIFVGKLTPGDFFGEMSLFTGEPRSATVEVNSDCLVFELTKESLNPILQQRSYLAEEFGKIIAGRQSYNAEKLAQSGLKQQSVLDAIVGKIKSFFHLK